MKCLHKWSLGGGEVTGFDSRDKFGAFFFEKA